MAEKQRRAPTLAASDFLKQLGPGLITGASDDDPSGIGTYSQAGAQLGFSIGWTMLLTFPLMTAIQEISAPLEDYRLTKSRETSGDTTLIGFSIRSWDYSSLRTRSTSALTSARWVTHSSFWSERSDHSLRHSLWHHLRYSDRVHGLLALRYGSEVAYIGALRLCGGAVHNPCALGGGTSVDCSCPASPGTLHS